MHFFAKSPLYFFPFIILLVACSDSGGKNDTDTLTGQFIDSGVSGLSYSTPSQSGVTDTDGQFTYLEGETVTFSIGDTLLGSAEGQALLTPFDLIEGADPVTGNVVIARQLEYNPAYSAVVNMSVLLQTLDMDGMPDNGITISKNLTQLFQGVSIDLQQYYKDFSRDRLFRQLLREANAQSLFEEHRQFKKPWRTMAHLYSSLGLQQPSTLVQSIEQQISSSESRIQNYFYGEAGDLVRQEEDREGDGAANSITHYNYDQNGNTISIEYDNEADGVIDSGDYRLLNVDGAWLQHTTSYGVYYYFYNEQGLNIRTSADIDKNGSIDTTQTFTYNDRELVTRWEHRDESGEDPLWFINQQYDSQGRLIYKEEVNNPFSTLTIIRLLTQSSFNPDENNQTATTTIEYASGIQQQEQSTRLSERNEAGYLTRRVSTKDGEITFIVHINLDELGRPTLIEEGDENSRQSRGFLRYHYDNSGNLVRLESERDGDGAVDEETTFTYEDIGSWDDIFGDNWRYTPYN